MTPMLAATQTWCARILTVADVAIGYAPQLLSFTQVRTDLEKTGLSCFYRQLAPSCFVVVEFRQRREWLGLLSR